MFESTQCCLQNRSLLQLYGRECHMTRIGCLEEKRENNARTLYRHKCEPVVQMFNTANRVVTRKEHKNLVITNIVEYLQLWDFHLCLSVLNNLTFEWLGWALFWRLNLPHSSCPSACLYPRVDLNNKNTQASKTKVYYGRFWFRNSDDPLAM